MTDRAALRSSAVRQVTRWEQRFTDALNDVWSRQQGVVLARLQGTKARKGTRHWAASVAHPAPLETKSLDVSYIVDPARWMLEATAKLQALMEALTIEVFGGTYSKLNPKTPPAPEVVDEDYGPPLPDDLDDDLILSLMRARLQRRLDMVARGVQTASTTVQQVINDGDAAGKPMTDIADDVKKTYEDQQGAWTDRIVTTNVVGMLNESSIGGATQAGCEQKQWLSAHDTRVRPTHRHADGQVVPITGKFQLGGIPEHPDISWLEFPGDPTAPADEVINCRCTMIFPLDIGPTYASGQIPFADTEQEQPPEGNVFEEKAVRHVRTPEGERLYHEPIGSVIAPHRHEGLTERNPAAFAAWSYWTWTKKILREHLDRLPHDDPDRKVDWVSSDEIDEHHRAYSRDPDYKASFNAWYADAHGTPYAPVEQPTAKYRSYGGSSLWVYADGHGSAHFTGKAGTAEQKELAADEVAALLAKGSFHPAKPHAPAGDASKLIAALQGGGHGSHSSHHGPPLVPPTDVDGLPGVRWTDERSPGGPAITLDAAQLKKAFGLVGIEMTPGLKVNVHLRDQQNAGEQGVTWQSGPNSFEVTVKVLPGAWPEPEGSLYVINNSLLHELRHVRQAQLDPKGHDHFSQDYAHENMTVGYGKNKYELDARLFGHLADPTKLKPVPNGMTPIGKSEWVLGAVA